jgi:hypothetical protein
MEKNAKYKSNKKYYDAYRASMDRIDVFVPQGKKQLIKEYAAKKGESMTEFINRIIDNAMQRGE